MPIPAGTVTPTLAGYRPATATSLANCFLQLDDWAASAIDDSGVEWWLTGLEGWNGSPDPRLSGVDRSSDHGQFDGPTYLASRVITATGVALAPDQTTALYARDVLSSLCWDTSRLYTLTVTEVGRPTRRADVRLNAATKIGEINPYAFDWQIQLKAPDPRRYGDEQTVVLNAPTGVSGGVTLPLTVPVTLTTAGTSTSSGTITNSGTFPTRPVVEFIGPLVDPQIANVTAGRTLGFEITLAAGDTLTADFDRRTVLLNGTASRSNTLTATAAWWQLDPGGNDVVFTAGGGTGTAVVRYSPAWL